MSNENEYTSPYVLAAVEALNDKSNFEFGASKMASNPIRQNQGYSSAPKVSMKEEQPINEDAGALTRVGGALAKTTKKPAAASSKGKMWQDIPKSGAPRGPVTIDATADKVPGKDIVPKGKLPTSSTLGKIGRALGGPIGIGSLTTSMAADYAADKFGKETTAGKTAGVVSNVATGAGLGAIARHPAAIGAGALAGLAYGLYDKFGVGKTKAAAPAAASSDKNAAAPNKPKVDFDSSKAQKDFILGKSPKINLADTEKSKEINPEAWKTTGKTPQTFGAEFAKARKKGEKEFEWQGKKYHTRTKEEDTPKLTAGATASKPETTFNPMAAAAQMSSNQSDEDKISVAGVSASNPSAVIAARQRLSNIGAAASDSAPRMASSVIRARAGGARLVKEDESLANELLGFEAAKGKVVAGREKILNAVKKSKEKNDKAKTSSSDDLVKKSMLPDKPTIPVGKGFGDDLSKSNSDEKVDKTDVYLASKREKISKAVAKK